jgi:hypothetical protein
MEKRVGEESMMVGYNNQELSSTYDLPLTNLLTLQMSVWKKVRQVKV